MFRHTHEYGKIKNPCIDYIDVLAVGQQQDEKVVVYSLNFILWYIT